MSCQLCEESVQIDWKCFDCKLLMCNRCKGKIHPKIKLANKHRIVNIKHIALVDFEDKPDLTSISCTVHEEKLCCLFCKSCGVAICSLCVTETHIKHDMTELSEGYEICLEKLRRCSVKIDNRSKSIKLLGMVRYEEVKWKIAMQEKELISAIQNQTKILSRKFERHWDSFEEVFRKEVAVLELNEAVKVLDANETFPLARNGIKAKKELKRINTRIKDLPIFVPKQISSTSIEQMYGSFEVSCCSEHIYT